MEGIMIEALERVCARLSERQVNLFLGAGINSGIHATDNVPFPLGTDLSRFICTDLLEDSQLVLTLDEASEQARFKVGEVEFNRYIYDLFARYRPGRTHSLIIKLPWDTIYTTNFDLLLEQAAESSEDLIGTLRVITSIDVDLSAFSENDTLYYKLHGSVELANTPGGRLILTKEDYRTYEQLRSPLFKRLQEDIQSRAFIFLGYVLGDPNFRAVLEDCRNASEVGVLPLSYAVRPGFRLSEEAYWRDKYNIQLLDCTAEEFLKELCDTWYANAYTITPLEKRKAYELVAIDELTEFPRFAECYYRLIPDRCGGSSRASEFFKGSKATWADVRDGVPPPRDALWDIMEALFDEFSNVASPASAYLISGHAGTGKTTLLRTLAYTAVKDFNVPVLVHIPGTPLQIEHVRAMTESEQGKRLVILVHDGAEICEELSHFFTDVRREKLPITVLIEERTNQWNTAMSRFQSKFAPDNFELGPLSPNEVETILAALERHEALGVLKDADKASQIEHFTALAEKELLVALRELTSGTRFDDIVTDEYEKIPSDLGKQAYSYVAAVGQVDLYIRYNTLQRLLQCDYQELADAVFKQTEDVLLSSELVGKSRHTLGYKLRVRHPIIASIVFAQSAQTDQEKYRILNSIITNLDPGYPEDKSLLNELVRRRDLVRTFSHDDFQRAIYDRLSEALPLNPFVFQHRSILERELGNADEAIRFAREAVRLQPHNLVHSNTLGMALEFAARTETDTNRKKAMLLEATKIFQNELASARASAFAYLGLAYVMRQEYISESNNERKQEVHLEALSLLEQAREETERSEIIEREYARVKDELGDRQEAIRILKETLKRSPANTRVRDLCVRFLVENRNFSEALRLARDGLKHAPTDWRLFRHVARLLDIQGAAAAVVREQYEGAIRNNRRDADLLVELGAF